MKNLKKKKDGGREKVWEKTILNDLIGFDELSNKIKWVLLGNSFYTHMQKFKIPISIYS